MFKYIMHENDISNLTQVLEESPHTFIYNILMLDNLQLLIIFCNYCQKNCNKIYEANHEMVPVAINNLLQLLSKKLQLISPHTCLNIFAIVVKMVPVVYLRKI